MIIIMQINNLFLILLNIYYNKNKIILLKYNYYLYIQKYLA